MTAGNKRVTLVTRPSDWFKKKQRSLNIDKRVFPKPDLDVFDKIGAFFEEIDAWRISVISASKPRNFDLCVSGAVRRDFDVAQSSEICAHAVSLCVLRSRHCTSSTNYQLRSSTGI